MKDIKFGTQIFYSQNYDFVRKKVKITNQENWDAIWLPDHLSTLPGSSTEDFLSLWPMFGSIAELAKGMTFGSAVTEPHRYHPAVLAQLATSVNHITGGNFILGIGAGEGMNLKAYNIPYDHAITKMRECIALMKMYWKKGTRVTFDGKFYQSKKAYLLPQPLQELPIWIAGNGPKTRKLTAELAEGWLPFSTFFDVYKAGKEEIVEVLKKEGRDIDKFTFGEYQRIYMEEDEKKINQYVMGAKLQLALSPLDLKTLGYWRDEFDQLYIEATGYNPNEMSILVIDRYDIPKFDMNKLSIILDQIPDSKVRENILVGSKEEIIKKIQRFVELGVQHYVLEIINGASSKNAPFTYWDVSRLISEDIIPIFKNS